MSNLTYSNSIIEKVLTMLCDGLTLREISYEFGMTTTTVHKIAKIYLNRQKSETMRIFDDKKLRLIRIMLSKGIKPTAIAKKLECSAGSIYQIRDGKTYKQTKESK